MAANRGGQSLPNYEQAGELKFGQVGIANLRVRELDIDRLASEMRERIERAPNLFDRAAVVLDFGGLSACPSAEQIKTLIDALRRIGALPVALAYGTKDIEALSKSIGLPLLAKFRASYETAAPVATAEAAPIARSESKRESIPEAPALPAKSTNVGEAGLIHTQPVRSGQQIYAQNRDLTVCATIGAGAEVLADGSIHIYGALRGRALAGASGATHARIFCREFHAELVAIAGHYKVLEDIPKPLRGKAIQVWLDSDETLQIAALE